jgi:hypothetical protein
VYCARGFAPGRRACSAEARLIMGRIKSREKQNSATLGFLNRLHMMKDGLTAATDQADMVDVLKFSTSAMKRAMNGRDLAEELADATDEAADLIADISDAQERLADTSFIPGMDVEDLDAELDSLLAESAEAAPAGTAVPTATGAYVDPMAGLPAMPTVPSSVPATLPVAPVAKPHAASATSAAVPVAAGDSEFDDLMDAMS